jgi:putative copper export protein
LSVAVFLHLLAACVWVGGLVFLGLAVAVARGTLGERDRIDLVRALGRRFLLIGGVAALLLAVTGVVLVDDRFGGFNELGDADGGLVIGKTVIFACVVALAAVHSFGLGPRMRRIRERIDAGDETARVELGRLAPLAGAVQGLILLGTLVVLGLAAALVS